ncbi:MAG: hypothetical protein LUE86_07290 [Clostridiales bacterium]|nr:hypothetical protein [Clostridiales bacterium]
MNRKRRLSEESCRAYVDGLRRMQAKGVRVLIDGLEADDSLWGRLFENRADGGFYMGDYIMEDMEDITGEEGNQIREDRTPYGSGADAAPDVAAGGKYLKEIRFEVVYHDRRRARRR